MKILNKKISCGRGHLFAATSLFMTGVLSLMLSSCGGNKETKTPVQLSPIMEKALYDKQSAFYADFPSFPKKRNLLPIGVFDSGTGGLTVLEALLKNDMINNITGEEGSDGLPDLTGEDFIYLADRANMPYGNYRAAGKEDFFKELVVKDALFLLGDTYYMNNIDSKPLGIKDKAKIIVIACNTATAYGLNDIQTLLECSSTGVKVIGVINAGVKALFTRLDKANKSESNIKVGVGVIATTGTIASGAYEKLIEQSAKEKKYKIFIESRGAKGIAESVDMEKDYVDDKATKVRVNYKGPILGAKDGDIYADLLSLYNFNKLNNGILFEEKDGIITNLQLNSSENYARFHLVSLIDNYLKSGANAPLGYIIMGCTHYPFLIDTFIKVIEEMRSYKKGDKYVYKNILADSVVFIDPAIYTAKECYDELRKANELALKIDEGVVSAFISIPAFGLTHEQCDTTGNLTYEFKYGRDFGTEQQSTVVVPFSRRYLNETTIENIRTLLPESYKKITNALN